MTSGDTPVTGNWRFLGNWKKSGPLICKIAQIIGQLDVFHFKLNVPQTGQKQQKKYIYIYSI